MAEPISMGILAATALAGTAMSTFGAIRQGQAENIAAKFEARQMEARAKEQEAAGQQAALEQRRKTQVLQSRALAVAGASGAGALDPNVLRILAGLESEGEQSFQSELFNARSQAELLRGQAAGTRFSGKQSQTAGYIRGAGTALSGLADAGMMYYGSSRSPGGFDRTSQDFAGAQSRNVNIPGFN